MKELHWNDESVDRYNSCNRSRYYGHIKNFQDKVYICDKEENFWMEDRISESLIKIQEMLKKYEENGYEYFHYKLEISNDGEGGSNHGFVDAEFYRLETEEERKSRIEDFRAGINKRLVSLKKQIEEAQSQLEALNAEK